MRFPGLLLIVAALALALAPTPPRPAIAQSERPVITAANAAEVRPLARLGRGVVRRVVWSHDGMAAAVVTTIGVWLHELDGSAPDGRLIEVPPGTSSAAFSPDDAWLAIGADDGAVHLWDRATGERQRTLLNHLYWISALAFNGDGSLLASADASGIARIWRVPDGAELRVLEGEGPPSLIAFNGDSTLVAAGGPESTRVWETATGAPLTRLSGIADMAFSPRDDTLAVVLDSGQADAPVQTVQLYDARTGALVGDPYPAVAIADIGFAADGQLFIVMRAGNRLDTLAADTLAVEATTLVTPGAIDLWPGPRFVAERGAGSTLSLYPRDEGWFSPARLDVLYSPEFLGLEFTGPDVIVARARDVYHRFDLQTGAVTEERAAARPLTGLAIGGPNLLARFGSDNVVYLETVIDHRTLRVLEGHAGTVRAVAFSPDARLIATGADDSTVFTWDVDSGQPLARFYGHLRAITALAFSVDGSLLASASLDGTIRLWNPLTGDNLAVLEGHNAGVTGLVFSEDGTRLSSASYDGTVRLWGVPA